MTDRCPRCHANTWNPFQGGFCTQCGYGMDKELRSKYGFPPKEDMETVGTVTGDPHSEDDPVFTNGPGPGFGDPRCGLQPRSRPSRDETWLRVAEVLAERGTCPRRQVGCVIVDAHSRVMATGYNGPATGRPHCSEGEPCPGAHFRSGEGLDKCEAIHAEQNACLLLDDPWQVDTIYITASPCLSCVKLLLGTSAKRIVCREIYPHPDAIEWWKRAGREMIQLPKEQLQLRA